MNGVILESINIQVDQTSLCDSVQSSFARPALSSHYTVQTPRMIEITMTSPSLCTAPKKPDRPQGWPLLPLPQRLMSWGPSLSTIEKWKFHWYRKSEKFQLTLAGPISSNYKLADKVMGSGVGGLEQQIFSFVWGVLSQVERTAHSCASKYIWWIGRLTFQITGFAELG